MTNNSEDNLDHTALLEYYLRFLLINYLFQVGCPRYFVRARGSARTAFLAHSTVRANLSLWLDMQRFCKPPAQLNLNLYTCCTKLLRKYLSTRLQKLHPEAQIVSQLDTPNLFPVYNIDSSGDTRDFTTWNRQRPHKTTKGHIVIINLNWLEFQSTIFILMFRLLK